jgi:hypothetical protein
MALLVGQLGIVAVPLALAVMATLETLSLGLVLWLKLHRLIGEGQLLPQAT